MDYSHPINLRTYQQIPFPLKNSLDTHITPIPLLTFLTDILRIIMILVVSILLSFFPGSTSVRLFCHYQPKERFLSPETSRLSNLVATSDSHLNQFKISIWCSSLLFLETLFSSGFSHGPLPWISPQLLPILTQSPLLVLYHLLNL